MNTEKYHKRTELLKKFDHGDHLYRSSQAFNNAIQMLVNGVSEYHVIEQLVQMVDSTSKNFEDHLYRYSNHKEILKK